jgi:hypothetical protein
MIRPLVFDESHVVGTWTRRAASWASKSQWTCSKRWTMRRSDELYWSMAGSRATPPDSFRESCTVANPSECCGGARRLSWVRCRAQARQRLRCQSCSWRHPGTQAQSRPFYSEVHGRPIPHAACPRVVRRLAGC